MAIQMSCPCGRRYQAPVHLAGKRMRCRHCRQILQIPGGDPDVIEDIIVDDAPVERSAAVTAAEPVARPRGREPDDNLPLAQRAEADFEPAPRPRRRKRRRPRYDDDRGGGLRISVSPGIIAGAAMMFVAVVWFILGLYFGWIFFYPPVLFLVGLVRFVLSVMGHEED